MNSSDHVLVARMALQLGENGSVSLYWDWRWKAGLKHPLSNGVYYLTYQGKKSSGKEDDSILPQTELSF